MAYRNLIVQNAAVITCKNQQLIIRTDAEHNVPIEDISCLLIESRQSTITTACLSALAQNNVCVYLCDEKHMPCAVLQPFSSHSRHLLVVKNQLSQSKPANKQLWQQIVRAKIANQAECLSFSGRQNEATRLRQMAATVTSGDGGNLEGAAAAIYFKALFGATFIRRDDADARNACLNYGYAILRGAIARHLAAYGFLPCVGIHHCSEQNAFNLADDLIEPYRPLVDLFTACNISQEISVLTPQIKQQLLNLLNLDIRLNNASFSVAYAIERTVQSLGAAHSTSALLTLPILLEAQQHCYE